MANNQGWDEYIDSLYERKAVADKMMLDAINKETQAALKDAHIEFGQYQKAFMQEEFNKAVRDFYDAYDPKYYKEQRRGSLYEIFDAKIGPDGMVYDETEDYSDSSLYDSDSPFLVDRNNESLFDKVFKQGWHGGAEKISADKADIWGAHPNPGTPYYRRPGKVLYPGEVRKRFHRYGRWGKMAIKTTPPYELFRDSMLRQEGGVVFDTYKEIVHKHNDKAVEKFYKEIIPRVTKEVYEM